MDGTTVATASGIVGWLQGDGQLLAFAIQLLNWLALGFAAVFAAWQYKRHVDFLLGVGLKTDSKPESGSEVEIEEFVD